MNWRGTNNLGMILLGVWLIITGLLPFLHVTVANMGMIISVLAVAAGSLILLGR